MVSTMPVSRSVRANSAHVQSDSERPAASGSSHASLTRWVATSGGKNRGTPTPRIVEQSLNAFSNEPLRPLGHDPASPPYHPGHIRDRRSLGQRQNHSGANDSPMFGGLRPSQPLEL